MPYKQPISQFLDTLGTGAGTTNIVAKHSDGELGMDRYKIVAPAGEVYNITSMTVYIEDATALVSNKYGTGIVLTNGLKLEVRNAAGTVQDLTGVGYPVKTNADWLKYCSVGGITDVPAGSYVASFTWNFLEGGQPVRLRGDYGEFLALIVNDDFDDLVTHYFHIKGYTEEVIH